ARRVRACFVFQAEDGIRDRNVTGVHVCSSDLSLSGLDLPLMRQYGFTPLNGHATNGLIRHPSEYLDGQLAQDILGEPGVYCVTEVIDPDDTDALIGWSISRYEP